MADQNSDITNIANEMSGGDAGSQGGSDTQHPSGQQSAEGQQQEPGQGQPAFEFNKEGSQEGYKPTAPVIDIEAEIEKRFGKKATAISEELSSIETLRKKAEAKSYRTAYAEEFDNLTAPVEAGGKGVPAKVALQYLEDTTKMSDRDYKALMLKMEYGSQFTDSEIQGLIDSQFLLGKNAGVREGDDELVRSEKEKEGLLKLKFEVANLRKQEGEFKKKLLEPYASKGTIDAQDAKGKAERAELARKEAWKPTAKKLVDEFKNFKIPVGSKTVGEGDKARTVPMGHFNYEVPQATRDQVAQAVNNFIDNNPDLAVDANGQARVNQFMRLALLDAAAQDMFDKAIKFGNSQEKEFWSKQLNNVSLGVDGGKQFDQSGQGGSGDFYEEVLKSLPKN